MRTLTNATAPQTAVEPFSIRRVKPSADLELERLYRRYHSEIAGALTHELGDCHDAEDVTQEAFLNAFRALSRGNEPAHPRGWLHAIALNASRRRHRKRHPQEVPLETVPEGAAQEPQVATAELLHALSALPPDQQAAFLLREVGGYSYGDVATLLGRTEASVQMLLFRARQKLRAALGARVGLVVIGWQRLAQLFTGAETPLASGGARAAAAVAVLAVAAGAVGSTAERAATRSDRSALAAAESTPGRTSAAHSVVSASRLGSGRARRSSVRSPVRVQAAAAHRAGTSAGAGAPRVKPPQKAPAGVGEDRTPDVVREPAPRAVPDAPGATPSAPQPSAPAAGSLGAPGAQPPPTTQPQPPPQHPKLPAPRVPALPPAQRPKVPAPPRPARPPAQRPELPAPQPPALPPVPEVPTPQAPAPQLPAPRVPPLPPAPQLPALPPAPQVPKVPVPPPVPVPGVPG